MIQTERQEDKVAENASNRRKWEGNHNGISSQQNKGHKVLRAHTTWPIYKKAYAGSLPLCNQCKFHHNGSCTVKSLRHYKSECPIVKFQKCVDMIHEGVRASKPKTMQDAIEFATKLMDKKISTPTKCQAENKRKLDNTSKNNQNQQQSNKRQNTGRAYAAGHGEKKHYGRSKPLCSKCNYHHDGPCAPKCHKCNRVGHMARDCKSSTNANTANNQMGTRASRKATCCEYGNQGHYRNDCPERKNQNHENQTGAVMSSDSAVTYTSVHSEARSWSIPSEDPYEEAARQLLEQAPRPSEYVPDPMELEDHVPVYIPEPEHPEDLVPAEDEAPIEPYITEVASTPTPPLPPPSFLPTLIRPPHTRSAMAQRRAAAPSTYHSLLPSGMSRLLPIPLPTPYTSRRADVLEADMPVRRRLLLTAPTPRVDHSFIDTVDTRVRDTERRTMVAVEVVNLRVNYQADVRKIESLPFYSRHQEAQEDRATVRAKIEILRRERLAYEQESIETRQALARSEAYSRELEARIKVLETQAYRHEWQRQDADDRVIEHIITMAIVNQGMSVEEIEQIVAQRVANAIEAIAIYESINQTKASAWWQQLKLTRERIGKPRVTSWRKMKKKWEDNGLADNDYEEHPVYDDEPYEEEVVSRDVGVCTFVVDPGSCDNLIAEEAVQKLGLKTENRPKPYKLQWLKKGGEVTVSKRVLVAFSGKTYKDSVWCDVVPMDACHLLLGRPWDRAINKITVRYRVSYPRLDDLLDQIVVLLSTQIRFEEVGITNSSRPGDEWKTAFKTREGLYEWKIIVWTKEAESAFSVALGVLSQGGRPVAYFSEKLTEPKSRILLKLHEVHKAVRDNLLELIPSTSTEMQSKSDKENDSGPSIEERAILFLEAQDRVKKGPLFKRQPGSTMARRVDHSFVDTVDTWVRDTERRTMAAIEMVNLRVSYQAGVGRRESLEFYSRHLEVQEDRAAVRAKIEILRRERLAYEQESIETRQALARSEAYSRALEARIRVLETQAYSP
ncbi:reverse transcriptase domain-containing protein [Tanacetum coccineum]